MDDDKAEAARLVRVYSGYNSNKPPHWSRHNAANIIKATRREYALYDMLCRSRLLPLGKKKILDVGCGSGNVLSELIKFGAEPDNLIGIDIHSSSILAAKLAYPSIEFHCVNAETLPFAAGTFDIVMVYTVFSSIQSDKMALRVAAEIVRVLRPGGSVIWRDLRWPSLNQHTRPISRKLIRRYFDGLDPTITRSVTLAPPLARLVAPAGFRLYSLLEQIPALRCQNMGVMMKPELSTVAISTK